MRNPRVIALAAALLCSGIVPVQAASKFTLTSSDLPAGKSWDDKFIMNEMGCSGGNVSPALSWTGAPAGTKSFAIMMFDPYTPPVSGWWHWILYDLPPTTTSLPTGAASVGNEAMLPAGAKHGLADGDAPKAHYYGPCPDIGDKPHHYTITVYALKIDHIDVPPTATPADINYLAEMNKLGKASIIRPYQRKK